MNRFFKIICLAPLLLILTVQATPAEKILVSVTTDKKAYKTTDSLAMAITILNQSTAPCRATFGSGKIYDFYLYRDSRLVWKWSSGKMFTMSLSSLTLTPQTPSTYVISVNSILYSGKPLDPGRYNLVAAFCTKDSEYDSEPIAIEIY